MDIGNVSASLASAVASNQQQPPPAPVNQTQPEKQQASTVVKLSEQAQQKSRTEEQNANRAETARPAQEAAQPQGIQFMEGERKGGRVDTLA